MVPDAIPVDLQAVKSRSSDFCLSVDLCIHSHREDLVDVMTQTALRKRADSGTRTSPRWHQKGPHVASHADKTEIPALLSLAEGHVKTSLKRT